jgi:hypothetical protein
VVNIIGPAMALFLLVGHSTIMKPLLDILLVFGIPMLMTIPVTALLCRYRIARKKRASWGTLLVSPVIANMVFFLSWSFYRMGWHLFTREAWTNGKGGLVPVFFGLGFIALMCVLPALGVVVYYQQQSKRDETQQNTTRSMEAVYAILFTIGLYAVCTAASMVVGPLIGFGLTCLMVLGTSLWAAIDSSKIQLKRYQSGISYGPVALFLGCVFLWIVGFPWYLIMRHKIKTGTAVLKNGATKVAT